MVETALKHYRLYCIFNLIWYAALLLGSITLVLILRSGTLDLSVVTPDQIKTLNGSLIFLAIYSWVFFAITLSLMKPQRTNKWWTGAFMNIIVGVLTCCLVPLCLPLAIKWNSQEVKDYFNPPSEEGESTNP